MLVGCGNPHMGKLVKKDMSQQLTTPTGQHHHFILTHIVVDYNYSIYPERQMIILEGSVDDRQQDAQAHFVGEGWDLAESHLDIYFLNAEHRVVDYCIKKFPLGDFTFPYNFKAKCRYNSNYRYAALAYKYKYNKEGFDIIKVYEHPLDIE